MGRLYDAYGRPLQTHGQEHIVVINSRYSLDPWVMLEKVMTDEEYEDYLEELQRENKQLFKIFYDQPVVRLAQHQCCEADILYALSFVNQCYSLCQKGIKRRMLPMEENLSAKIRGRIDIPKNIRKNTSIGRNDRFYCKYVDFTTDTTENRILKATLIKCKKIMEKKFRVEAGMMSRLSFCMNALRGVQTVKLKDSDFNQVNVTGLFTYYKPLLKQAKCIIRQKYTSYLAQDGITVSKSVYTIPYMINMEAVFEFYVRTLLRDSLDANRYYLEKYSSKIFPEKGVTDPSGVRSGIHLTPYCIPDIIIKDKLTRKAVMVLDSKYKSDDRPVRSDSYQLLTYVLLTGAKKCGFVMPGQTTGVKKMGPGDYMELATGFANDLQYYELLIGNTVDRVEIEKIL